MRISFNLYKLHDIDLLTLYFAKNFNFTRILKIMIRGYINGSPYLITPPATMLTKKITHYKYTISLNLNEIKDADIIEWLKTVQNGCRTAVIKAIIRGSVVGFGFYPYMKNPKGAKAIANGINSTIDTSNIEFRNEINEYPIVDSLDESQHKGKKRASKSPKNHIDIGKTSDLTNIDIDETENLTSHIKKSEEDNIKKSTQTKQNDSTSQSIDDKKEIETDNVFDLSKFELSDESTESTFANSDTNNDTDAFDLFGDVEKMINMFN